jgi:hypothetical protein
MNKTLFNSAMLVAAIIAAPAQASSTSFFDNFDAEGSTKLNYTGFANFTVESGSVDLISNPDPFGFGISCAGGTGSCVDLDGSTGTSGFLLGNQIFSAAAGELISVSFDYAGNQRGGAADTLAYGFRFLTNGVFDSQIIVGTVQAGDAFATYTASGSYGTAEQFQLFFQLDPTSTDNVGVILDNVSLSISAVPEPASWAMMIAGVGLAGGALRRRRTITAAVSFA